MNIRRPNRTEYRMKFWGGDYYAFFVPIIFFPAVHFCYTFRTRSVFLRARVPCKCCTCKFSHAVGPGEALPSTHILVRLAVKNQSAQNIRVWY